MKIVSSVILIFALMYFFIQQNHLFSPLSKNGWSIECGKTISSNNDRVNIQLPKNELRCEIARHDWISLEEVFDLSFGVRASQINLKDSEWHSLMQVHALPDKDLDEGWRCPVMALEVVEGQFRVFNRWDENKLSILKNGTCSSIENTIQSRTLFKNYDIQKDTDYLIRIQGVFTARETGWLKFSINGEEIATVMGPTAFNDTKSPYIKLGIYKPSTWLFPETLEYTFHSINFEKIITENKTFE